MHLRISPREIHIVLIKGGGCTVAAGKFAVN